MPATASGIEAPGPQGPLRGTLAGPATADAPVVLMIPGSGPGDRDGNQLPRIRAATLRLLAEALAARGITSVRVDKRGLHGSSEAVADPENVTLADYARDTRNWISAIRARTGTPCVWLLGHSEGGLVALKTAQADPAGICGLMLAATPGRPLGIMLREQFEAALPDGPQRASILAKVEAILTALEAGRPTKVDETAPYLAAIFRPSVQPYLIDLLAHDPRRMIAGIDLPVLILQGDTDLQVTMADAEELVGARPAARLVRIGGANHVFKQAPADRAANLATYADPQLPLADGVVDAVAAMTLGSRPETSDRSPSQ
ncbi:MAG: alpha/beta hydrolase [Stappia sp.]|nr:alpha/beta hydrolase [Stappia sp.]MBM22007.1 alpha/beta hydrolase [Stappia sp.]